jgi:hypothetical protein
MYCLRITGILVFALAAGCAGGKKAAQDNGPEPAPAVAAPAPVHPPPPEPAPVETISVAPGPETVVAAEPATPPEPKPAEAAPPAPPAAPASPPKAATAAAEPAPFAPAAAPVKPEAPPPPAAKPSVPTLDVAALKERLKECKAIGVFTKLALKNQVDDLLKQFQAYYQSRQQSDMASLRQAYNMLVLKVLTLIQDGDPSLARTISASREAIWNMLADPVKFKSLI